MFVPAKCTHLFQSVDTGLAAYLKGRMRRLFQLWITDEVMAQLGAGTAPDEVREHAEPRTVQGALVRRVRSCGETASLPRREGGGAGASGADGRRIEYHLPRTNQEALRYPPRLVENATPKDGTC